MRSLAIVIVVTAIALCACSSTAAVRTSGKPAEKGVSGSIVTSDLLQQRIASGGVIFLHVNRVDASGGLSASPLAVAKVQVTGWPLSYSLSAVTEPLRGLVEIVAWYDKDGDVKTKQSGDILGRVRTTAPAQGVQLELDTIR